MVCNRRVCQLKWLQLGPVSLILSVDSPRDLDIAQISLKRLLEAPSNGTLQNPRVSYLVYLKGSAGERPNAYLNFARLVSQTNHAVLFPKPLLELNPTVTYSYFYNATHLHTRNAPVVLTASRRHSEFPFSPFSPLMIHRDDPTWCDERFDFLNSPPIAWEECLWQFWITKHGGIQPIASKNPWKAALDVNRTTVRRASGCEKNPFLSFVPHRLHSSGDLGTTSATRSVCWPSGIPLRSSIALTIEGSPPASSSNNRSQKSTRTKGAG